MGKEFAHVKGLNLAYLTEGQGEPLLLVHGISTYSFIWRQMIPLLAKRFRVIAVDLLGCGDSDKPMNVDYSISAQADLVSEFLKSIGVAKVHIVGHDVGGGISQIFAVRNPEKIMTLIMINPVGYDYWPVQPIISLRIPVMREIGMAALDLGFFRLLAKRGVFHKERVTDELMNLFEVPLKNAEGRQGLLRLAHSLNNKDLMDIVDDIRSIRAPTLIIRGETDAYLPEDITRRLHEDIKGSKLVSIPTCGHFAQEDEPELLARNIIDFIDETSGQEQIEKRAYG